MKMNYPDSEIFLFEPVPSTFELFRLYTEHLSGLNIFPFTLFNEEKNKHILMGSLMKKLRGRISAPYVAEKVGFINGGQK